MTCIAHARALLPRMARGAVIATAAALVAMSCGGATQAQASPSATAAPATKSPTPIPTATPIPAPADLVAAGKIRIVLDPTSPAIGTRLGPSDFKGAGWDVALELARRIGVKAEAVEATGAKLDELAASGGWDIGIVVTSADMDTKYAAAGPLLRAETGYLVRPGSAIKTIADVDKPGVRIVMVKAASTFATLQSSLKNATLVGAATSDEALALFKAGDVDVLANAKPRMGPTIAAVPGSVILDGAIAYADYGMYGPKGNEARLAYLKDFVASIKKSGFLKAATDKAAVPGLIPAP